MSDARPPRQRWLALGAALLVGALLVLVLVRDRPGALPQRPGEPLSSAASAAPPAPVVSAPAASAGPAPGGSATLPSLPKPPACRTIELANEALLGDTYEAGPNLSFAEACFPMPGGTAWALRVTAWQKKDSFAGTDAWAGAYDVIHLDRAGDVVKADLKRSPIGTIASGLSYTTVARPRFFDFDSDGDPEIFLTQDDKEHEGGFTSTAVLLTFRGGKVIAVPGLPKEYDELADADSDGRPDILYHPYSYVAESTCSGFFGRTVGPALLAHARPDGRFSLDDDEAVAFARRACPTPGGPADGGEEAASPELCARLWGASAAEALALLKASCRPKRADEDGCALPPEVCESYKERAELLRQEPPLRIR